MEALPKLLIVDDLDANLLALKEKIEDDKIEIITCTSGNDAIKLSLQHDFFLILMDVQMPNMNGFEAVTYIKKEAKNAEVPIIFVTAISKEEKYIHAGYNSGAVDYLFKPIDSNILNGKIRVFKELHLSKLMLSQRNAELKDFARVVSHDLKSPLAQIVSLIELVKVENRDTELSRETHDYLKYATDVSKNMINLIDGILNYNMNFDASKKEKLEFLNILHMVESNLELAITQSKAVIEYSNLPGEIYADEAMAIQLFQNFISNSIKYQKPDSTPHIKVVGNVKDNLQSITIEDNGIGFSESHAEEIFTMFTRAHIDEEYDGHGIGLATCKKIVNALDWKIDVQSKVDIGSRFTVIYPVIH